MARPTLETLNSSEAGWLARLNDNFEKIFDAPIPLVLHANVGALTSASDPKLFKDCFALVGASGSARLYSSDGTTWTEYLEQLANIADLNPGTAILSDIVTAYNNLINDMQAKGYML